MKSLEVVIPKIAEWILCVGFTLIGILLLFTGEFQLGLIGAIVGIIMFPLLKLPLWFRVIALVVGGILL